MGILSGFIGGAAQAGGDILQRERESEVRKDEARFADDLAGKRQQTVMELQNQFAIDAEQRGIANRATERGQIVDETVANAPRLRDVKVEDVKATERAKYDPEIQKLMVKAETQRLTAAEQAKLDFFKTNKPAIVDQARSMAAATHIESAGSLAQAALANLQLTNAKQASELRTKLAAARSAGDDTAVQSIQQQITDLAFTGKDTAAAYRTYSTAQAKLIDLESKLANADPTQTASIRAEIEDARAMQRQAAKDLGVNLPDRKTSSADEVRYDAQGRAYVKGPDGKPMLKSDAANQKGGTTPAKTAAPAKEEPAYVPPADSPAGKRQAAIAARAEQDAQSQAQAQQQALAAFNAVGTDPAAAAELQASPLFSKLSLIQKAQISQLVRGR